MREVLVSKRLPKLRQDSLIFKMGVSARRIRKDRDQWELINEADDMGIRLYYEDLMPTRI